ncbi:MAG: carboxypeptidase M32, partial [Bacteroidota bacterium]
MNAFDQLKEKLTEIANIRGAASLLLWDQEVMMPKGAAALRARQLSTLMGLHHHKFVHEALPLLDKAMDSFDESTPFQQRNLIQTSRDVDKFVKLPNEHVRGTSQLASEAVHAWSEAKAKDDFSIFED